MANLGYPCIRMYWSKATRIDRIAESMSLNQYFKIRANIHVNAAIAPDSNKKTKFWIVEPLISAIRSACLQLLREEKCAIDEQKILFTGRVPAKQFIKSKPNPVGLKNFFCAGNLKECLILKFIKVLVQVCQLNQNILGLEEVL